MPSINLATGENASRKSTLSLNKGVIFSLVVLVFIFLVYGGLLLVNKSITSKTEKVIGEYEVEYKKFLSGSGGEIIDFKNRSAVAEKLIKETKPSGEIFSELEDLTIPQVYLNSLEYDESKKVIDLECVGDSLVNVSRQIASFRQSDVFSSVNIGQIIFDKENNKLNFSISLKLK